MYITRSNLMLLHGGQSNYYSPNYMHGLLIDSLGDNTNELKMNKNINCLIQVASATMNNKNCVSNKLAKGKLPDRKKCEVDILSP